MFDYKYTSTKEYVQGFPCAYRQWKAQSHCNQIHGYAFTFKFYFSTNDLDAYNWVVDYGGLKPLKALLEDWFDHTLLMAVDDPQREEFLRLRDLGMAKITEVEKTGCEGIADFLYEYVNTIFLKDYGWGDRVWCTKVEVRETNSNMAYRSGDRDLD